MSASRVYITSLKNLLFASLERRGSSTRDCELSWLILFDLVKRADITSGSKEKNIQLLNDLKLPPSSTAGHIANSNEWSLAARRVEQFFKEYSLAENDVLLQGYVLALKAKGCSASTIKNYLSDIRQILAFASGAAVTAILTETRLLEFARGQERIGLAASTIRRKLTTAAQFAKWLSEEHVIEPEVAAKLGHLALTYGQENGLKKPSDLQSLPKVPDEIVAATAIATNSAEVAVHPNQAHNQVLDPKPITSNNPATDKKGSADYGSLAGDAASPAQPGKKSTEKSSGSDTEAADDVKQPGKRSASKPRFTFQTALTAMALVLSLLGFGLFARAQFITDADSPMAYPSALTRPARTLSFQGRLTDSAQNPVTVPTDMAFRLYDTGPGTGGTQLWTSGTCSVTPDQDGIFAVGLGDECGTEIDGDVFSENTTVWLEVEIESETLTPRQSIKAVAYALNSETLQGYPAAAVAMESTVVVMNELGQIMLGSTNPIIQATSVNGLTLDGQALYLTTTAGSDGNVVIDPDGTGIAQILSDLSVTGGAVVDGNLATNASLGVAQYATVGASLAVGYNNAPAGPGNGVFSGNLGVGTSSPAQALQVMGSAAVGTNLGIGTTNPTERLRVEGNIRYSGALMPGGSAGTGGYLLTSSGGGVNTWTDPTTLIGSFTHWQRALGALAPKEVSDDLLVGGAATSSALIRLAGTSGQHSWFNTGGNLGVGTTVPTQRLDIDGQIRIRGGSPAAGRVLVGDVNGVGTWTDPASFGVTSVTGTTNEITASPTTGAVVLSIPSTFITPGSIASTTTINAATGLQTGGTLRIDASGNLSNIGTIAAAGPITLGGDVVISRGAADRLDLASGDSLVLQSGNIGIGTTTLTSRLNLPAATVAAGGINFGNDTNLYRHDANILRTDDGLIVGSRTSALSPGDMQTSGALSIGNVSVLPASNAVLDIVDARTWSGGGIGIRTLFNVTPSTTGLTFNGSAITARDVTGNTTNIGILQGGVFTTQLQSTTGITAGSVASVVAANSVGANNTMTNYYGFRVGDLINSGTIGSTYGVHVGDITTGTQTNTPFSFYASDVNTFNYFAGNTGIGTASPAQRLSVSGNALVSGNVGIGTTAITYPLNVQGDINTVAGTYRMAGVDYGQYFIDSQGTTGQIWQSDGAGRGIWTSDLATGTTIGGAYIYRVGGTDVALADGGTNADLSGLGTGAVIYKGASSLAGVSTVAAGNVLLSAGAAAPTWGKVGLTTHVTGTLPIANGGTNATSIGSAGTIAYSTGTAYAFSSVGTSGYLLTSGGTGTPTWTDPTTLIGSLTHWQRNDGALAPKHVADDLLVGSAASSSALIRLAGTSGQHSWFNTGGNLGVGTTSPAHRLDVAGTVRLNQSGTPAASSYALSVQNIGGGATWLEILNNGGANQGVFFGISGNDFQQWNYQGGPITFYTAPTPTAGTERMRITNAGNVGIGSTAPAYKLDVVGTGRFTGALTVDTLAGGVTDTVVTHDSGVLQARTINAKVWGNDLVDGVGQAGYNAYWTGANTLAAEQYVNVTRGGLGANMTAAGAGELIYSTSTSAYGRLAAGTSGMALISGGAASPTWGTLGLTYGGTNANLSSVATGGLIYKAASALAGTGALTGIVQGNGSGAPTAITGTAGYLPRWSASAPYLTTTSQVFDDGTNVGIGTTNPGQKLDVVGNILVQGGGSLDTRAAGTLNVGTTTQTSLTLGRATVNTTINGGNIILGAQADATNEAVRADRTLQVSTGNGITGGGAAVDLTANRSWTLGLTGQALALHNLNTNGIIVRTGAGTVTSRSIAAGNGISVTNGDGVSANPSIAINSPTCAGTDKLQWNGTAFVCSPDINTDTDTNTFLGLLDTPSSYAGQALRLVRVNSGQTALEFIDPAILNYWQRVAGNLSPATVGDTISATSSASTVATFTATGSNIALRAGNAGVGFTTISSTGAVTVGTLGGGGTNEVVTHNSGLLQSRTINSKVWDGDLVDGVGQNNYNAYWTGANTLAAEEFVNVTRGGLGANMTAAGAGELIYSTSTSAYGRLAAGTSGMALISGGAGSPTWGTLGLTYGGTNANLSGAAQGGVIYKGASALAGSSAGTTNQVLTSGGSGMPTFQNIASLLTAGTDISITGTTNATINNISTLQTVTGRGATTSNAITISATGTPLTLSGDTTTLSFSSATGTKQITTGGTTHLALMPGGNVGVGTTAAGQKLDVAGNILVQGGGTIDTRAAGTLTIGGTTQTGLILGRTGQSTRVANLTTNGVVFTSGGNGTLNSEAQLAIARGGTNASTIGSAGTIAYSTGTAYAFSSVGTSGYLLTSGGTGTPTWTDPTTLIGSLTHWQRDLGALAPKHIADDVLVGGAATASARIRLPGIANQNAWFNLGTGNLGVGTTTPVAKLDVRGAGRFGDGTNYAEFDADGDLLFTGTSDYLVGPNRYAFRFSAAEDAGLYFNFTQGGFQFTDGTATSIMHIGVGANNVGIGTVTPAQALHVIGNVRVSGLTPSLPVKTNASNDLISGAINLASAEVTGILPIGNGGTNTNATPTAGAVAYGTGTAYAFNTAGTSGMALLSGGTGAPTFGTLGLTYGGTNANLSSVATGGLIYKAASALAGTGALTGIVQGNGSSAPTAITGTAGYLPRWSGSAPYLTATSQVYDNGTNVGIGTTTPGAKLDVDGSILVAGGGGLDTRAAGALTVGGATQTGLTLGRAAVNTTINGANIILGSQADATNEAVRADRTLQVSTGNGITGGGSAVDLTANRSWTLGLTGQALALHNLNTNGIIVRTGAGTVTSRSIAAGNGISVSNGDGVSANPTIGINSPTCAGTDKLQWNGTAFVCSADVDTDTNTFLGLTDTPSSYAGQALRLVRVNAGQTALEFMDPALLNYWQRIAGNLSPATLNDTISATSSAATVATFTATGSNIALRAGNAGLGVTTISSTGAVTVGTLGGGGTNEVVTHNSGLLQSRTINSKVWDNDLVDGSGTTNYLARWTDADTLGIGVVYDNGTNVGIGTTSPGAKLDVDGSILVAGGGGLDTRTGGTLTIGGATQTGLTLGRVGANSTLTGAITNVNGTTQVNLQTAGTTRWSVLSGGIFESNGAQTIRTSTGALTLATNAANGNILITPNGSGNVGINTTSPGARLAITHAANSAAFNLTSNSNTTVNVGTITANGLSSGTGLVLGSSSTALTSGGLFNATWTAAPSGSWTGSLGVFEVTGNNANVDGNALRVGITAASTAGANSTALNVTSAGPSGAYVARFNDDGTYADTTPFVIDHDGNVGIGTTTLGGNKLMVDGTIAFTTLGTTNTNSILCRNSSNQLAGCQTLNVGQGGTGHSTYAVGDILYADTTSSLARRAIEAAGNVLISGTTPTWGKVGLTTHVTGTLPITNGGTNTTSIGGAGSVAYSNGSAYAFSGVGTNGHILASGGSGAPTWVDPNTLVGALTHWQRDLGALAPKNITDDVLVGHTATASALVRLPGITNQHAWFSLGTGNVGVGTTTPVQKLHVAGDINVSSGQGFRINNTATAGTYLRGDGTRYVSSTIQSGDLPGGFSGFANPSATIGLTAVNGVATTAMRSDAAPALSQAIVPTWTGAHTFTANTNFPSGIWSSGGNIGVGTTTVTSRINLPAATVAAGGVNFGDDVSLYRSAANTLRIGDSDHLVMANGTAGNIAIGTTTTTVARLNAQTTATGANTIAVRGLASGASGTIYGVWGESSSTAGTGVYGQSPATGVNGLATGTSGSGVRGVANAGTGTTFGVYGEATSASGYAIYGVGRGYFSGNVGVGTTTPGQALHVAGDINVDSGQGFRINNTATSNHVLRGNGTRFVSSASQALTKNDDANVTLTLGGTPTTALLDAVSITVGWTGQLAIARGGTNSTATPTAGGVAYGTGTAYAFTAQGTGGQVLVSAGAGAPIWQDATLVGTNHWNRVAGNLHPVIDSDTIAATSSATNATVGTFTATGNNLALRAGNAGAGFMSVTNTGVIRGVDGAVGTPSYSFTNDTGMGMYRISASNLGFSTGGAERLRISNGGNVAIGTTATGFQLNVQGDINTVAGTYRMAGVDYGQYFIDSQGTAGQMWRSDGSGRGAWSTATYPNTTTVNQLLYSSSNNIVTGLATANNSVLVTDGSGVPGWADPSMVGTNYWQRIAGNLSPIINSDTISATSSATAATVGTFTATGNNLALRAGNSGAGTFMTVNNTGLIHGVDGSAAAPSFAFGANTGTGMYRAGTNIIGLTTNGTLRWSVLAGGILQSNGAQTVQTSTGALTLATGGGNGHIVLSPNGTGNVGIGTATPGFLLDVNGTGRVVGALTLGTQASTTAHAVRADRTLQVSTTNGITGGGGAVDLTTNRSWTLELTGQALALHNLNTNGIIVRTGAGTVTSRSIAAGGGISVTNGDGVSGNPTIGINSPTCAGTDKLQWNGSAFVCSADVDTNTTTFIGLTDTPGSYSGQALRLVRVNSGQTALEFVDPATVGTNHWQRIAGNLSPVITSDTISATSSATNATVGTFTASGNNLALQAGNTTTGNFMTVTNTGLVRAGNGLVGTPSLSFTEDNDTGFYSVSANNLGIATGGGLRWTVLSGGIFESNGAQTIRTSTGALTLATGAANGNVLITPNGSGNVGINTTSPAGRLDVVHAANSVALALTNNTATTIGAAANTLGVLDLQSTSLTTGNFMNIEVNGLTSGRGINVSRSGAGLATNGTLLRLDMGAATAGNGAQIVTTGAYTGTGLVNLTANNLSSGTVLGLSSSSTALSGTTGGLITAVLSGAPSGSWTGDLARFEITGNNANVDGNALKVGVTTASTAGANSVALNVTSAGPSGAYVARFNDDGTYADTTPFVIDFDGNVGIGTTTLGSNKLMVNGTVAFATLGTTNTNTILCRNSSNQLAGCQTLTVSQGGTGATTLTGMLKGNGAGAFTAVTGTTGYNTYWVNDETIAAEQFTNVTRGGLGANMTAGAAGALVYSSGTSAYTTLPAGTNNFILKANGAGVAPSWADPSSLGLTNFWQRVAGNLSPSTLNDTISATSSAATVATFTATGSNIALRAGGNSDATTLNVLGSGSTGIGTSAPASQLHVIASGAKTGSYAGTIITNTVTSSTASIIKTGLSLSSVGTWNGTGAVNRALYVSATDGTFNYAAIFDAGNVGIGSTAPGEKLDVTGNVRSSGVFLAGNGTAGAPAFSFGGDANTGMYSAGGDILGFSTNSTLRWSILAGGILQSNGAQTIQTSSGNLTLGATGASSLIMQTNGGTRWSVLSGGILESTGAQTIRTSTGALTLATNAANGHILLTPNGTGNVGIGTTSPATLLDVAGGFGAATTAQRITNTTAASTNNIAQIGFTLNRTTGGLTEVAQIRGLITDIGNTTYKGAIAFLTSTNNAAPTEKMRLDPNGNLGIGTTTSSQLLHVAGNARVTGAFYDSTNSPGSSGQVLSSTVTGTAWTNPSASVAWNAILDPTGAQSLAMAAHNTTWSWSTGLFSSNWTGNTSTNNLFSLTTNASVTGTGSLLNVQTGTSAALSPLRVRAGSVESLFVNSAGNVGIGTTTASLGLDIAKDTRFQNLARFTGAVTQTAQSIDRIDIGVEAGTPRMVFEDAGSTIWLVDNFAGTFRWFIPGSERMSLADSSGNARLGLIGSSVERIVLHTNGSSYFNGGNLGIGTTTPASLFAVGSTSQFQVNSSGAIAAAAGIVSSGNIDFASLNAGGMVKAAASTGRLSIATAGTDYEVPLTFSNGLYRSSNTVRLGGWLTQQTDIELNGNNLSFWGEGNVGIGTDDPQASLHVIGFGEDFVPGDASGIILEGGKGGYLSEGRGGDIYIAGGGGANGDIYTPAGVGGDVFINAGFGGHDTQDSWPNGKIVIGLVGNVGIGTANPSSKLHVAGDVRINGHIYTQANDTYDIGSNANRWRDLYLGADTLHIGTSTTDEGVISYDTSGNIFNFGTDSTTNGDIAFFTDDLYLQKSTGRVGIGTTSPSQVLDVNGSLRVRGNNITDSGDTTRIALGATTTLTNTTTTLSGTTTLTASSLANISSAASVAWTGMSSLTASSLATLTTAASVNWGGATSLTFTADNAIINGSDAANSNLVLRGTSSGTKTTSYLLLQDNGGNVGIGTTTPGYLLDVANRMRVRTGGSGTAGVWLSDSAGTDRAFMGLVEDDATPIVGLYNQAWRLVVGDTGIVGIGTTNPTHGNLHVVGTVSATTGFRINNAAANGNYLRGNGTNFVSSAIQVADVPAISITSQTTGTLTVGRGGTGGTTFTANRVLRGNTAGAFLSGIIEDNGTNVGIGVAPTTVRLAVNGNITATQATTTSHVVTGARTVTITNGTGITGGGTGQNMTANLAWTIGIGTTVARAGTITTNYIQRATSTNPFTLGNSLLYDNGTNVGIGTTSGFNSRVAIVTASSGLYSSSNGGVAALGGFFTGTGYGVYGTTSGNTTDARGVYGAATTAGGIGVFGQITGASGRGVSGSATGASAYGVYAFNDNATATSWALYCLGGHTNSCGGNRAWNNASDARLKENIQTIPNALDTVLNLRGVTFDWKDGGGHDMGFIAQEVMNYVPTVVGYDSANDVYSMRTSNMVGLVVEAIKEQNSQVVALQNSAAASSLTLTDVGNVVIGGSGSNYAVTPVGGGPALTQIIGVAQGVIGKLYAGLVTTKDLVVTQTASIASLSVQGLTIGGQSLQAYIENIVNNMQLANTTSLPAGSLVVENLTATGSSQLADVTADSLNLNNNASISGNLTVASGASIAGILNTENVQTQSLQANSSLLGQLLVGDASVSGTLTADHVVLGTATNSAQPVLDVHGSARITALEAKLADIEHLNAMTASLYDATISGTLYANSIANFDQLMASSVQPTLLQQLIGYDPMSTTSAQLISQITGVDLSDTLVLDPAALDNLPTDSVLLGAHAGFFSQYLQVNGNTALGGDVLVVGKTSLASGLSLENNSVSYLPAPLEQCSEEYIAGLEAQLEAETITQEEFDAQLAACREHVTLRIQPTGSGVLDLMNGLLVAENGSITINGQVTFRKSVTVEETLLTDLVAPTSFDRPFQLQVAGTSTESGEVKKSRFELIDELGTPVATISAEGVAEFSGDVRTDGRLRAQQGIAIGNNGDMNPTEGEIAPSLSAGKSLIPSGQSQITIVSSKITEDSLLNLTLLSDSNNQVLYVKQQQAGQAVVGFKNPVSNDTRFNWWIIE